MATKKTTFDKVYATLKTANNKTRVALTGALEGIEVDVVRALDIDTVMEFAAMIASSCVDIDEAEYTPEAFDFVVGVGILQYYAGMTLPDDYKKIYRVLMETDLIAQIMPFIDEEQLESIKGMANARIAFVRNTLISTAGVRTIELLERVASVMGSTEKMTEKLSSIDLNGAMESLAKMAYIKQEATSTPAEPARIIQLKKSAEKDE